MRARDRWFRLVVRLYPSEFRDRFGADMESLYREARMDAAMRGRRGAVQFWIGVIGDALVRAPGEHMRMLLYDLRHAARGLRRSPMFTLVAVTTLALGIGANTAIFSVVHAVALQPLPNRDPARLIRLWEKNDSLNIPRFSASVPNYMSWRERTRSFEALGGWRGSSVTLTTGGEPQRLSRLEATATLLPLLGVEPLHGRGFSEAEDKPGASRVALLAESVWRNRFGAREDLVGSSIVLDGVPHAVIGIVRDRDFVVPFQVLVPLAADLAKENRSNHLMTAVGRLRPGVELEQAQREMDAIALQLAAEFPADDKGWGVTMATFYDWIVPASLRNSLYVLLACVGLVLLIACTNIANLTLARTALRRRDQAVRLALGASRGRIVREVLTESVLLSLAGGAAGMLLAYWAMPFLRARVGGVLPRAADVAVNPQVMLFTLAVSVVTGLLFGILPALLNSKGDVSDALKDSGRGAVSRHQGLTRRALVVAQLCLATIVLSAAALLLQSFIRLQRVELGFEPAHVTTAMVGLPAERYRDHAAGWQFYQRVMQSIAGTGGVDAVAISSGPPLSGGNTGQGMRAVGANALGDKELQSDWRMVSPTYFATMGIPLLRGRTFNDGDRRGSQPVMVLSQDMARRFWPNEDPVGRTLTSGNRAVTFLVVGVAGDVRNLNQATDPRPTMYLSATQFLWPAMTFVVRTRGDLPAGNIVRQSVLAADPQLAVYNVRTFDTLIDTSLAQPRMTAWLFGMFAALSLLLAAIGVYGVLAYLVAQRTREIGVRLALGAKPASVLRLVVGHSLRLSAVGIGLGAIGAMIAGPALESQLFGVRPRDPATLAGVAVCLLTVALVASYLPARRATRVNPLTALRTE
jgi:putative ABC transport system permease protein